MWRMLIKVSALHAVASAPRLEGVCMPKLRADWGTATERQVHMALGGCAHQSHQNHRSRTQAMITRDWETGEGEMLLEFSEVCVTTRWISPTIANHTLKMGKPGNSTVCDLKKKNVIKGVLKLYDLVLLFH